MERLDLSPLAGKGLKTHRAERRVSALIPIEAHLTEGIVKTRGGALIAAFELAGTAFEAKSLEQRDLDAGFVLACQAHPLTDRVVLSYDER